MSLNVVQALNISKVCPPEPDSQHPHPAAPSELQKSFADFVRKFQASTSSTVKEVGNKQVFAEYWEAPARIWRPRIRQLEDAEIDAISVCVLFCFGLNSDKVLMYCCCTEWWCFIILIR